MKSWLVKELGNPNDALVLEAELAKPELEENEVLIKVEATALNFFDILLCQGKYQEKPPLPFTIGSELSGTVVKTNKGSKYKEGQRILAQPDLPNGGLVEYISVKENKVFPIPDSMPWDEAASMFVTYHTSYYALHNRANLRSGEVLLVHAGAGGVGSAAIQLGKAAGAFVIATAGGEDKVKVCKELGADIGVDYLKEDFVQVVKEATNGKGADVIYDPVGGKVFERSRKCIAFDGRILVIGFASGTIPEVPTNHILIKGYSVVGVHWGYFLKLTDQKTIEKEHEELMKLYEEGKIKPLIYKDFQFDQVKEALELLGNSKTWGKLVVRI
ncbi:NADPH:quinone oxidoreductase family protein [Oceanobacillus piezotolerans]|uniref:NADPH:quinone oxidoreductase family protein n=1 Tax=Oceanobacillus piezotolerans TaxID=2448030 RepID=A0A498DB91_9BACI|nr:NADPH:quinone oxidoreductase family protein [Oceanobacillus piezotolerans]RLL46838.1 NADPH:quinone oxidoreductase family protein [Oceanobacillus piezotolerans]